MKKSKMEIEFFLTNKITKNQMFKVLGGTEGGPLTTGGTGSGVVKIESEDQSF